MALLKERATALPEPTWLADLVAWLQAPVRPETEVKAALQQQIPEYRPAIH